MLLWGIAKKARAIGNRRHASAMTNLGKRALALSKAEYRMWKKGQSLRKRSFAANRALKAW
jgi:ABC-type phosphonate transport system ATPase subunit